MPLNSAGGEEQGSAAAGRPPNEERSFYKFIKKDFEDLSLGRIKRPKRQRKSSVAADEEVSAFPPCRFGG